METTTKRPGRLATIVATAVFGVALAVSAISGGIASSHDEAAAHKPLLGNNTRAASTAPANVHLLAGGGKPRLILY
jgi:hypothetical protein